MKSNVDAKNRLVYEAVDLVWSGHNVGFAVVRNEEFFFITYYDQARQLSIARRCARSGRYVFSKIGSWVNWDSHCSISLALDRNGLIHISGNMHNDPLNYWISREPGDISRFDKVSVLCDPIAERSVTYPKFLNDKNGELIFHYRSGSVGHGNDFLIGHDSKKHVFRRIGGGALIDGENKRNAYAVGPLIGPDAYFHMAWLWRASSNVETTHHLCYACSSDLEHWETSDGQQLAVPINFSSAEIVDPIPEEGGAINSNILLGFDYNRRPVIAYHKFDDVGITQIFISIKESTNWVHRKITHWSNFRWEPKGPGSIYFRLRLLSLVDVGKFLRLKYTLDEQEIEIFIDTLDLKVVEMPHESPSESTNSFLPALSDGMIYRSQEERWFGQSSSYSIVWATQRENRDFALGGISNPSAMYLIFDK